MPQVGHAYKSAVVYLLGMERVVIGQAEVVARHVLRVSRVRGWSTYRGYLGVHSSSASTTCNCICLWRTEGTGKEKIESGKMYLLICLAQTS